MELTLKASQWDEINRQVEIDKQTIKDIESKYGFKIEAKNNWWIINRRYTRAMIFSVEESSLEAKIYNAYLERTEKSLQSLISKLESKISKGELIDFELDT